MTLLQTTVPAMLAAVEGGAEVKNFPLSYQIACVILTAIFLWTFSIARDPRGWRRLYQAKFGRAEDFSVNRNKKIDETIKRYGHSVAMVFLVAAVWVFVAGVTYRVRHAQRPMTQEERNRAKDTERILDNAPKDKIRRAVGS